MSKCHLPPGVDWGTVENQVTTEGIYCHFINPSLPPKAGQESLFSWHYLSRLSRYAQQTRVSMPFTRPTSSRTQRSLQSIFVHSSLSNGYPRLNHMSLQAARLDSKQRVSLFLPVMGSYYPQSDHPTFCLGEESLNDCQTFP